LKNPKSKIINVEAFSEEDAKKKASTKIPNGVHIGKIKVTEKGAGGFLGIGKKPSIYQIQYTLPASVEPSGGTDLMSTLVHDLLMQLSGTWIKIGDNQANIEAAVTCFIEWKLTLGNRFAGALVFQDADELAAFSNSQVIHRLMDLGDIKHQNLNKADAKHVFRSLRENTSLFLLTWPFLSDLSLEAWGLRSDKKDTSGLLALWRPMPTVCIIRDPTKVSWGKNKPRTKKPCCASVRSLFGLEGLIMFGKETILDEKTWAEGQKIRKRLHME